MPDYPLPELTAQQRLAAAAPALLDVCVDLVESAEYWSEYDVPCGIVDRLNAAITKAGGTALQTPDIARPITDRAKEYHAWRDRLSADPTCWQFSDREEAIAYAAFIAGWWLRTGDNPDDHFNPPTNVTDND